MTAFACGVPKGFCTGGVMKTSFDMGFKGHGTSQQAFDCHRKYLLTQGYQQIGSRTFRKAGEPIMVLAKKSHFGARLRRGKESTRHMPARRTGGYVLIS